MYNWVHLSYRSGTNEEYSEKKWLLQELVDLEMEGAIVVEDKKKKAKESKDIKSSSKTKKIVDLHEVYLKPSTSGSLIHPLII